MRRILVLGCVSKAVPAIAAVEKITSTYLIGHNAFGMDMGSMQLTELEKLVAPAHQVRPTWGHYPTAGFQLGVMNG